MKKKRIIIISSIIALILVLTIIILLCLPKKKVEKITTADVYQGGVKKINTDGLKIFNDKLKETYMIKSGGVYNLSGTIENGYIKINTNDNVVLNLTDVKITNPEGSAILIEKAKNAQINIIGEVTLEGKPAEEIGAALYSKDDLRIDGEGKLTIISSLDGIVSKDDVEIANGNIIVNAEDDGITGRDSVVVSSGAIEMDVKGDAIKTTNDKKGTINIKDGVLKLKASKDGLQSCANIIISNGVVEIETGGGIEAKPDTSKSAKGIKSSANTYILGGVVRINALDDAIHTIGTTQFEGGTLDIQTLDDAIHSEEYLNITGGAITITKAHEGLEGIQINISGGDLNITTEEDGINASGGKTSESKNEVGVNPFEAVNKNNKLNISGGTIYVNAGGDGVDSNGYITMSGGTLYIDGPTNNGNGALDYGIEFKLTGGELIAVGSTGMAENVSDSSTQMTVRINLDSQTNQEFTFGDIKYAPKKNYQSIVISSSKLKKGAPYELVIGGKTIQSVTLNDIVSSFGKNMGRPGGGQGPRNGNRRG